MAMGDCNALRQTADLVEKIDGTIAKDYMRKTKCSAAQVKSWMDAETWFTADEALAAGFIDEIESNTQAGDMTKDDAMPEKMAARWNLAAYDNAPKPAPPPTPDPAAAEAEAARITAQALAQIQINRNRMRLLVPI
jgi:ATP-dependent Clp protease protease subunit